MKKAVSIVLIMTVVFGFFSIAFSAFAVGEEISVEDYSSMLAELVRVYDTDTAGEGFEGTTDITEIPLNRLIIKTDSNSRLSEDCGACAKVEGYGGFHVMQYASAQATDSAYEYYVSLPEVESVEYDFCFKSSEFYGEFVEYSYDKKYLSWGSATTNADSAVSYANFILESAPEIVVAVLDTGIDSDHELFENRIIDSGVDLVQNDGDPEDDGSHGTHVAGIIADNTAENVKVSAYKVLDRLGFGKYSVTCSAINLAVEKGVDVINMSLRWIRDDDDSNYYMFENSIQNAVSNGVCVVVAAGNETTDAINACPAGNSNVITVASTDSDNTPSYFSNYGECVDIAAPGSGINSSIPDGIYGKKTGTSMATPFVAAAAALLKTLNRDYTSAQIENIIKENAFIPDGWDTSYGAGILDFSGIISSLVSESPKITLNKSKKAEIYSGSENAVIYYTTDGTLPVAGVSKLYTKPVSVEDAVCIRAIACEKGKYPSIASMLKINWRDDITVRYKGTESMMLPSDSKIVSCKSSNERCVVADSENQTVYGRAAGKANVTVVLETGQEITYNVTVKYENWQLFIMLFLLGFWWY